MKALRIVLDQTSANYRKEESNDNKMTYPLPPPSTVIGALHAACGFREYHEMDISIQGSFESMHKEPYKDYCFFNSFQDDRGLLVKMRNENLLSTAFEKVAEARKSQGNSFRKEITIQVNNRDLMDEFQSIKDHKEEIDHFKKERLEPVYELIKKRKKSLGNLKKQLDKKDKRYEQVILREKEIKEREKEIKEEIKSFEQTNYTNLISRFRTLATSLKYYEILNGVHLILHIKASEEDLECLLENVYNIKSIGRSEDTVSVSEACIVELSGNDDCDVESYQSAYIRYEELKSQNIFPQKLITGQSVSGTKYYLNKNYEIIDGKRRFQKVKAVYMSEYGIENTSANVFLDSYLDGEEKKYYIVNFL